MLRWSVRLRGTPKRIFYRSAVSAGHKVYCFKKYKAEVHIFNTVSSRWTTLHPVTNGRGERPLEVPSMRKWHMAVLIEDIIYIWGGVHEATGEYCNVLDALDIDTHRWFKPRVSGTVPKGREGHSACVLEKVMFIYGGYGLTGYTNDINKLDSTTMVWSLINIRGTPPPVSSFHSATIIGTKMFVFGGRGDQIYDNNIRVFDTETNCWLSTPSTQLLPEGRWGHSAFAYNGELYIFGGDDWEMNQAFNDLWKFNPETFNWKKVEAKGKAPCSWMSEMSSSMVGDRIILFGGFRNTSVPTDVEDEDHDTVTDLLYILDLSPSLKTLCKLAVIQYGVDHGELPRDIRWELAAMTTSNNKRKSNL